MATSTNTGVSVEYAQREDGLSVATIAISMSQLAPYVNEILDVVNKMNREGIPRAASIGVLCFATGLGMRQNGVVLDLKEPMASLSPFADGYTHQAMPGSH